MNKKTIILIVSISVIAFLLVVSFIAFWLVPVIKMGFVQSNTSNTPETLLKSTTSPDGKYTLEAYKTEPGATVDFSIKVYMLTENDKELIYNAYHEYDADIIWVNDNQVSINNRILDLSKNETFDWRQG